MHRHDRQLLCRKAAQRDVAAPICQQQVLSTGRELDACEAVCGVDAASGEDGAWLGTTKAEDAQLVLQPLWQCKVETGGEGGSE